MNMRLLLFAVAALSAAVVADDAVGDAARRSLGRKKKKGGKPKVPKVPRAKCVGVTDDEGVDLCKKHGGRCTKTAEQCKKVTKGAGTWYAKGCGVALSAPVPTWVDEIDEARQPCGCCIVRRPKDAAPPSASNAVAELVGTARSDSGTVSVVIEAGPQGAFLESLNLVVDLGGAADGSSSAPRRIGLALSPRAKRLQLRWGSSAGETTFTAMMEAHWAAVDASLPPHAVHAKDPDGGSGAHAPHHWVPETIRAAVTLKLRIDGIDAVLHDPSAAQSGLKATVVAASVAWQPTKGQLAAETKLLFPVSEYSDPRLVAHGGSGELALVLAAGYTLPFELTLKPIDPRLVLWPPHKWWGRGARRAVCVNPVRIRHRECRHPLFFGWLCFAWKYEYSGAGLGFGRPMADKLFDQMRVTIAWRPWRTIVDNAGAYRTVTQDEALNALRSEVDLANDDCVDVFFVPTFAPSESMWGGGACIGSGTVGAQIVSSDAMVPCGVDETHLAHEIAHALGLMHPGTGHAVYADGSTGSLVCPSGWERDNPRRTSVANKNNLVNPLLTNFVGPINWFIRPACTADADCGTCAAHTPADSC